MNNEWLAQQIILIPPLLFSLTIHELAHARTALAFGDPTAKLMGRCTWNPIAHLDPIGTLALIFVGFGWAKPVPVNPNNLHPPKWGNIAVSFAGPLSNLMFALAIALCLRLALTSGIPLSEMVWQMAVYTMAINMCLFIFNMLPLFPLDGHHIFREQLPPELKGPFMDWQLRYGRFVLMAIILGPRLIQTVTNAPLPSPLGWVIGHSMDMMLRYVILPA